MITTGLHGKLVYTDSSGNIHILDAPNSAISTMNNLLAVHGGKWVVQNFGISQDTVQKAGFLAPKKQPLGTLHLNWKPGHPVSSSKTASQPSKSTGKTMYKQFLSSGAQSETESLAKLLGEFDLKDLSGLTTISGPKPLQSHNE